MFSAISSTFKIAFEKKHVYLKNINIPEKTLQKTIKSGLKRNLLIKCIGESKTYQQLIGIQYDLWDQVYYMQNLSSDGLKKTNKFEKFEFYLNHIQLNEKLSTLILNERVEIHVLLSPLSEADLKKLQEIVFSQRKRPITFSGSQIDIKKDIKGKSFIDPGSKNNDNSNLIFSAYKVLGQNIAHENTWSIWSIKETFIKGVRHERK
jgi:hypothetical protein